MSTSRRVAAEQLGGHPTVVTEKEKPVSAKRQFPRWSQLKPLLRPQAPTFKRTQRRLDDAASIDDLRTIARRRTPRAVFDYVDGAAEAEISLRRARRTFRDLEFRPEILKDVSHVDLSTPILGRDNPNPILFGPTGFTRMMHHLGESAVATAAADHGIPYSLSTMGTTSIPDVAAAAPQGRNWFQLYVWKDRAAGEELMSQAFDAGYEALVLTVDVPIAGLRRRDVHNGMTIPPELTARTIINAARYPSWWFNLLTTEPLTFASLTSWEGTIAQLLDKLFDPTMTIDDLEWVRSYWKGPLVIKGIQTLADAKKVRDAGVEAIVLSNHGGRQLDRAPVPLRLLPEVKQELQDDVEVYVDTGVMSGADIIAAKALGADAVMVGRAYLYGLMAGGEAGVARAAEILKTEAARTMALLGASTLRELSPEHVRLPQ